MMRACAKGMVLCGLLTLAMPQAASAQQLLLHFPLDGTPAVAGSAAGDSRLYLFDGGPAPTTVPGKIGSALHFTGKAAIAMPFKLDAVAYPQVTITAWVRLDPDLSGDRAIFSAGNGNVPKLMVNGDRNNITAARGSLMASTAMPKGEWTFVAGVVDVGAARLENIQGEAALSAEGINVGNLYPPSSYRNPDDASLPATPYVFVGSHGFNQWRANGMAIDDVRVYASALTPEQIAGLRDVGASTVALADNTTAGACGSGAACAAGTYCAADGSCYPDSQMPAGYSPPADGPGLAGRWRYFSSTEGGFMSPGGTVVMEMELSGPDSQLAGTIHSAVQSMMGAMEGSEPMSNVVRSGNTLTFTTASIANFLGEISADGSRITTRSIDPSASMVFARVSADAPVESSSGSPTFYQAPLTEESLTHVQQVREESAAPQITYASEEEALAAQEQREREAAEAELARLQNELEAASQAEAAQATQLPYYPVGNPGFSSVAGKSGATSKMYDMETLFISGIFARQSNNDRTCEIGVSAWDGSRHVQHDLYSAGGSCRGDSGVTIKMDASVNAKIAKIGSIRTCYKTREGPGKESIQGLRITGSGINADGSTYYVSETDTSTSGECDDQWSSQMLCPTNPVHLATGLVVHSNEWPGEIVGLQLICRRVGAR